MAASASHDRASSSAGTILVLRTGDAVPEVAAVHGEFAAWIADGVGDAWDGGWTEHDARGEGPMPDPAGVAGIIVTGSSSSVTERAAWILRSEAYLRDAVGAGAAVLGICFGHQLLGQALGGEVRKSPRGREIGTVELDVHGEDLLLEGLPRRFAVNATHVDTVVLLPPGARVLAKTALEPNAVIHFGGRVRGVQFHPEIDGAKMRGYVGVRRPRMVEEGLDADAIHAGITETPMARRMLRNFVRHFVMRGARGSSETAA